MNLNNFIVNYIWIILWILGTMFTYFIWICPEWNILRVNMKLINSSGDSSIINNLLINTCLFKYLFSRFLILLFCTTISAVITIINWCSYQGKPINNLYDAIITSVPIIGFYTLLCGIKNTDSQSEPEHFRTILKLKAIILELFISFEKKIYIKSINKKIHKWYKNDNKNHKFAALIMRMSDESFVSTLKSACSLNDSPSKEDGAIKSVLYQRPLQIMEDYFSNDIKMNVLTNILDLVETYFNLDNCEPYKVMTFFSNHDLVCKNTNKDDILANIEKEVTKNSNAKVKHKDMEATKFDRIFNDYIFVTNKNI